MNLNFWYIELVDYVALFFESEVATINSKINGTPKGFYLYISKLHSILAVPNLLAYNNKIYYVQLNSLWVK